MTPTRTPPAVEGGDRETDRRAAALAQAASALAGARNVWIATHVDPDGDAIGTLLGLGGALRSLGKQVTTACQDAVPPEVSFLPGVDRVVRRGPAAGDLVVAVDAADRARLGDLLGDRVRPDLVLDHHASNVGFGAVNVIDPVAAAAAEVVVALLDEMGVVPDEASSTCLLAALVSDTLGFRTSATTARTLEVGRRLVEMGGDLGRVNQHVFSRPLATLRLAARAIDRLERHGALALAVVRASDLEDLDAPASAVRGITTILAAATEPLVTAVLRERADGSVDVSLRSKPGVDLVPTARLLGGGGHPQAAGALLPGPLDAAAAIVMDRLRETLGGVLGLVPAPGS